MQPTHLHIHAQRGKGPRLPLRALPVRAPPAPRQGASTHTLPTFTNHLSHQQWARRNQKESTWVRYVQVSIPRLADKKPKLFDDNCLLMGPMTCSTGSHARLAPLQEEGGYFPQTNNQHSLSGCQETY